MINIVVNGASGRMGQEVIEKIKASDDFSLVAGIDRKEIKYNEICIYDSIESVKDKVDVIIDFSIPESTFLCLEFAKNNNIPIVIATTGFSEEGILRIEEYSKHIPVFKSSNMSFEVNVMANVVANLANLLKDADIEIIESHHKNKIDAPSGTALMLADKMNEALNNEMHYEYNRHDKKQKRDSKEIGIHSIRGGTEVGKHTVLFLGNDETFEITHTTSSRAIFAAGALKAAAFIVDKKAGFYSMDDLSSSLK